MSDDQSFQYDYSQYKITKDTTKRDLLESLKKHDSDSYTYSFHTAVLNLAIAKEYDIIDSNELRLLFESGLFHDTGKLGMTHSFINYPGSYTLLMYNEMKKHAVGGAEILSTAGVEQLIIDAANFHHCNVDGSGYPGNLFGKEIPLSARITRISDSLDAYLSKRCYKEGGPAKEALDDLKQYSGTSYDKDLIDCLSKIHNNIMDECHKIGEDRPSQKMYMHFLIKLYLDDFPINKAEEILDLF